MATTADNRQMLNTREAAEYLGLRPQTLNEWRSIGRGPAFHRLGKSVRYDTRDLQAWLQSNRVEPTSA